MIGPKTGGRSLALKREIANKQTTRQIQSLVSALQAVVQSSNATTQSNLSSALNAFYTSVTNTGGDRFSPGWRQILRDIGGEELFGGKLKSSVEMALAANQITLAVALKQIEQIAARLGQFDTALNNAASALASFEIGNEKLDPGECEVGILIPRKFVHNRLLDFANELDELVFILNTFSEVATQKTDDLSVRTSSSSDFLVYVHAHAAFAACLSVAIERIVEVYKKLLEIRKLRQDIRNQGVPEETLAGLTDYANKLMEDQIETASVEIIAQFYKGTDAGRTNELTNQVKVAMRDIATRIDNGFNLEVRCEPLAANQDVDESVKKAISVVQGVSVKLQFQNLEGQPILQLPQKAEKPKKKDGKIHRAINLSDE